MRVAFFFLSSFFVCFSHGLFSNVLLRCGDFGPNLVVFFVFWGFDWFRILDIFNPTHCVPKVPELLSQELYCQCHLCDNCHIIFVEPYFIGPVSVIEFPFVVVLPKAYGDKVLSRTTADEWFKRFKEGRESVYDDERSGWSASSRTDKSVEKIRELIRKDRFMSVRLIEDVTDIRKSQVHRILNENLKPRKVCAWFVLHSLSDDQKHTRVLHAQDIILIDDNDAKFLKTIVAGDETWCFQYKSLTDPHLMTRMWKCVR